jgi:hypothetical protein
VTGTATAAIGSVSNSTTFIVTLKNPCINPAFVTVQTTPLPRITYQLGSYPTSGFTFETQAFAIVTRPIVHTLCGSLTYTTNSPLYTTAPGTLVYNVNFRTFTIYTVDKKLVGT